MYDNNGFVQSPCLVKYTQTDATMSCSHAYSSLTCVVELSYDLTTSMPCCLPALLPACLVMLTDKLNLPAILHT